MLGERVIGFIGAGNMAEAMIRGLVTTGTVVPARIIVTNRENRERLARLSWQYNIFTTPSKAELLARANVVILAVKPKDIPEVLEAIRDLARPDQVVISVAAGVPLARLEGALPKISVVRTMPNLATSVAASVTAMTYGSQVRGEDRAVARALFEALGRVVEVSEELMDAITALAGSGPAYVYRMMEAMTEAGANLGLPGDIALLLAAETVFGAAKLVRETGEDPRTLRQRVTSPGGTTMAGLQVLEERGFSTTLVEAIARAALRAKELAGGT
ncbi:MAG: pyrroline-5-carboxylate reductase [Armatimonadota bacterium]|nr:pyrroline-5-carboxylate reductase [Armatimonadota bacterium]